MDSEKIRVTIHSTALKLGRVPDPTKELVKDPSIAAAALNKHINKVGFALSYAQDRALHAVQVMLDVTRYKGNAIPIKPRKSGRYHFEGTLPILEIKTAEYLRAYGVTQTKTRRGKEFSPQARRVAMAALRDLANKEYLVVYEKSIVESSKGKTKKYEKVLIEDVASLIALEILNSGRNLKITPNPVLVDQVESYFIQKPREWFDKVPGKDEVAARFIDYLLIQGEMNRRKSERIPDDPTTWEIRVSAEALAWQLRMYAMLKARKRTGIREKLLYLYDLGVKIGYLASYQIDQPGTKGRIVDVLKLNPDGFRTLVPSGAESTTNKSKT